ncbi:Hypp5425 [Branchiostoma lanceolatum]|uniref:Hypp5425 protein n=1 Tax=Branchiostoma lanceolatum TaxID=7740 RepID=A0A8J9YRS8_BRALA|nr:Hypp5425 [Branchiostoma lanceolatum]
MLRTNTLYCPKPTDSTDALCRYGDIWRARAAKSFDGHARNDICMRDEAGRDIWACGPISLSVRAGSTIGQPVIVVRRPVIAASLRFRVPLSASPAGREMVPR